MKSAKQYREEKKGKRDLPHYHVSELTKQFLASIDQKEGSALSQIKLAWPQLVGAVIASKSSVIDLQEGVLWVQVSQSTVLSVLSSTEKPRLLRILQKRFPKISIRDISFRIG